MSNTIHHDYLKTTERNGELFFKIEDVQNMRPFLMSVVSHSNHWMFVASNGGLSAGRRDADMALFPYYTDDKLVASANITGSLTLIRVIRPNAQTLWEPFSGDTIEDTNCTRALYKSIYGNKVIFEEVNHALELSFSYEWNFSNLYGFVRNATLRNDSSAPCEIALLDGLQNIMPHGVGADVQNRTSNLVDAYKRSELHQASGVGIYALSAIIVDKAEPSEALKANVAWSLGLDDAMHLLSTKQVSAFKSGKSLHQESDIKGEAGAYLLHSHIHLQPQAASEWKIIANVNQTQRQVVALAHAIQSNNQLRTQLEEDIHAGTQALVKLVASADGLQYTADPLKDSRHYANTLFNIMRGGIFDNNYQLKTSDLVAHIQSANPAVFALHEPLLQALPATLNYQQWTNLVLQTGDADLIRLGIEYLPLKFSRRHGDPSRPWNRFSINTLSEKDGSEILDYEGNWRDIFQNWEALAHAFPTFLDGMIFKFLNASTFDGYNPYRITKSGIDWESIEPDDPWSYIGYWGDHQIIYLLKFLEFKYALGAESLDHWLDSRWFVYANVPYRIKPYGEILKDPKDTILFDAKQDHQMRHQMATQGADAALLTNQVASIHKVSFTEKILATSLSKMSNFIAEGGIWMNTQRPEWNDANNALVGNGISMVTLYYLHRFFAFTKKLYNNTAQPYMQVSSELAKFFYTLVATLEQYQPLLATGFSHVQRRQLADALGGAGSSYREQIYDNSFSGETEKISTKAIVSYCDTCVEFIRQTIACNKRNDGLYHAYNLLTITEGSMAISNLDEMLEGQVGILSAGMLSPAEAVSVLDAMAISKLYREDQNSFLLYPNKQLKGFLDKNVVPESLIGSSVLLQKMLSTGDSSLIEKDIEGKIHFNGNFKNANDLKQAVAQLNHSEHAKLAEQELPVLLDIFEQVFNHKAFTGRSGTFFGYEGLGSIYWHMVSKLHLAVAEIIQALDPDEDKEISQRLLRHFQNIEAGIGVHKPPMVYGAFPTDPYSHTPLHRGAQQPGMTGQVKEDLLVNGIVLGVQITEGCLQFNPALLPDSAFSTRPRNIQFVDIDGKQHQGVMEKYQICFSCCQTPVVYQLGEQSGLQIQLQSGEIRERNETRLDRDESNAILNRTGIIKQVTIFLQPGQLQRH